MNRPGVEHESDDWRTGLLRDLAALPEERREYWLDYASVRLDEVYRTASDEERAFARAIILQIVRERALPCLRDGVLRS